MYIISRLNLIIHKGKMMIMKYSITKVTLCIKTYKCVPSYLPLYFHSLFIKTHCLKVWVLTVDN